MGITIQNAGSDSASGFTSFSLGASPRVDEFDELNEICGITLTSADILSVKALVTLAITQDTSFLSIGSGVVADIRRNPNVKIEASNAVAANAYGEDSTAPQLVRFAAYDPTLGEMEL